MSVKNGTLIVIKIGDIKINGLTSNSMNLTTAMLDITSKDSGLNAEYIPDQKTGTISASGLLDESATYGYPELFAAKDAGTMVSIKYGGTTAGSTYYTANAYISSLSQSADKNAIANWTCDFQLTGAVTEGTVA